MFQVFALNEEHYYISALNSNIPLGGAGISSLDGKKILLVEDNEMNGYDATRAIRGLSDPYAAGIPIIAMTANAFDEDKQNAIAAGMNGHIAKPIDVPRLLKTLSDLLN